MLESQLDTTAVHPPEATVEWHIISGLRANMRTRRPLSQLVDRYNTTHSASLQYFNPTFVQLSQATDGLPRRVSKSLLCNYIFLRGSLNDIRQFCAANPEYSPIVHKSVNGNERQHLRISETEFQNFRRIAAVFRYRVPCFSLDEIDLERGDYVEIIGGPFDGVCGTLHHRRGTDGGRVIVRVSGLLAIATYDILPQYIKVLRFAPGTKRIYDVMDNYLPRLRRAIASHLATGSLAIPDIAAVSYFISRYGDTEIDTDKLRAKHLALLTASYRITDNDDRCRDTLPLALHSLRTSVTNPWTQALILQLLYIGTADTQYLHEAARLIAGSRTDTAGLSAAQREIIAAQDFYTDHQAKCAPIC